MLHNPQNLLPTLGVIEGMFSLSADFPAHQRWCLLDEIGLTKHSLGAVRGKQKCLHNDPYAGGERSGKCAKLDALFQAAPGCQCLCPCISKHSPSAFPFP